MKRRAVRVTRSGVVHLYCTMGSIGFGLGYRIYFGRDGDALIILLGGWTKARQQRDIEAAVALWREYRRDKRREG